MEPLKVNAGQLWATEKQEVIGYDTKLFRRVIRVVAIHDNVLFGYDVLTSKHLHMYIQSLRSNGYLLIAEPQDYPYPNPPNPPKGFKREDLRIFHATTQKLNEILETLLMSPEENKKDIEAIKTELKLREDTERELYGHTCKDKLKKTYSASEVKVIIEKTIRALVKQKCI